MHNSKIKLYDNGKYVGCRSQSTIEALYSRGLVDLKRNRKGYVFAASVRRNEVPKANGNGQQLPASSLAGQKYSYIQPLENGRVWALKHLNGRHGLNYAPKEALPDFTAVVRSCLK